MPDRAILRSQPRWIVDERLTTSEMPQYVLDGFAVGMEFRDVVSYVFLTLVAEHRQFGSVRLQNHPVRSDPMQTYRRVLKEVSQLFPAAAQFLSDAAPPDDLGPQGVVGISQLGRPTRNARL